jgi:predicted anti-sigma-YlaC factor YlaD
LEYLDHRLDSRTEQRIREHLAACPVCRSAAERLQKTLALVAADTVPSLPGGCDLFLNDVRRRIRRSAVRRQEWGVRRWLPTFAVAAALLLVAVAVWQFQRSRPSTRSNDIMTALAPDEDTFDLISSGASAQLDANDIQTAAAVGTELVDNSDIEDLIDDLTPQQQASLVQEMKQLYGQEKS